MIGIIAAARVELGLTIHRLNLRRAGRWWVGPRHVAGVSGVGQPAALRTLDALLAEHRIDLLIVTGFAGGLDPALAPGSVLEPNRVRNERGETIELEGGAGTLLTVDRAVKTPEEKRLLRERCGADAVDMETLALAQAARQRSLPVRVVRAISDSADMALPAQSLRWLGPDGRSRPAAAAASLLANPTLLPTMIRMARCARLSACALAQRLAEHP